MSVGHTTKDKLYDNSKNIVACYVVQLVLEILSHWLSHSKSIIEISSRAVTSAGGSVSAGAYMLAQWAVPSMNIAIREFEMLLVMPRACQGSSEPFGKTMLVTFVGISLPL